MKVMELIRKNTFLLLCLTGSAAALQAQTLFNKDSKISVKTNTILSVKGSVVNEGTLTNHGHLKVNGSWSNPGTYHAGGGEITFNSTSPVTPQTIDHNGQVIGKFSVTGGSIKRILSDVTIGKEIIFEDGVIEADGDSKIIFNPEAVISGASDRSHIHGAVYQTGSGSKLFPIGNGSVYLPVELPDVADTSAIIGIQGFESENLLLAKPASLHAISNKRYWHVDIVSGTISNSQIILPVRDESWLRKPEDIVVVQSSAPTVDFTSIGQSFFEESESNWRITSGKGVTLPFVALATSAEDAPIIVYNAVSPDGNGMNDFLRILNIQNYPGNKFSLFNRWGDKVFEIEKYDNGERVFSGRANFHGDHELVSGTYFYVIDLEAGMEPVRGFLTLKN